MAPITDNIEILKTKVDQIKKDLDALKAETNEAQKKTQAEAAAEKMKTAKEEINKKLEGLKGLTDENSKADVVKLEAMLKTVEGSDSELEKLKINVVEPSEAPKAKEAVDTTLDFTAITEGISAMKTMVTECQSLIDSYKSAKSTLSETEKTVKEKEIEEKKIAIEKKRKDIQAIIDKIKKARSEVKIDDITDETIKKALKEQKETEEKNISDLQKQLNALSTPATTFFEKVKN